MSSRLADIRDAVYTQLLLDRTNTLFVDNGFNAEKTYIPYEHLADLATNHPDGKVYVISANHGDLINRSRENGAVIQELPVQLGFQKADVAYTDVASLDILAELVEQLQDMCRSRVDLSGYSFNRIEVMKDEEDVPFNYVMLREAATFEAYFTAIYQYVL